MPYISPADRQSVHSAAVVPAEPGKINYLITCILDEYLTIYGKNYTNINLLIGALECAKLELYRRIAAPYEDKKIAENGDVYTTSGQTSSP